jgi:hypothetical protein
VVAENGQERTSANKAADLLTVRLSSGISANILDFGIPQKHVLSPDLLSRRARKRQAGARNRADSGSKGRKQGNELEIRNPAGSESDS